LILEYRNKDTACSEGHAQYREQDKQSTVSEKQKEPNVETIDDLKQPSAEDQ